MSNVKNILITGTSTGFGRLSVETLAKDGHTVFATMRGVKGKNAEHANSLLAWAKEHGHNVHVVELDVTSDESVASAAKEVFSQVDKVDVVVNNAGIFGAGLTEMFTIEDFKKIFEVNVFGVLRVTYAFLPHFRKANDGLFINVSSQLGRIVFPYLNAYTSSKFALESITETFRYELAPLGIDSVLVQPGAYPTPITGKVYQPSNAEVAGEYGPALPYLDQYQKNSEQMFASAGDPQEVANLIKTVVDTPAGSRNQRYTVGIPGEEAVNTINDFTANIQLGIIDGMGLGDLKNVKPAVEA